MSFGKWAFLEKHLETEAGYQRLIAEGKAVERFRRFLFNNVSKSVHKLNIGGIEFDCINMSTFLRGDFATFVLQQHEVPVAAAYYYNGENYYFSLRSDGSVNVAEIAGKYGGGGHKAAAAFRIKSITDLEMRWWKRQKILARNSLKRIFKPFFKKQKN
jgi:nanoRNase/pAp phosphatase (c-di-AMP/oligoRNAs hydrolase)